MLLSAVSVLVVAQSSSEIPEGLMNNLVYLMKLFISVDVIRKARTHARVIRNTAFISM